MLPVWLALVAASAGALLSRAFWFALMALWTLALACGSYRFTAQNERTGLTRTMAKEVAPSAR